MYFNISSAEKRKQNEKPTKWWSKTERDEGRKNNVKYILNNLQEIKA
jgi:hypothetical protein